MGTSEQGGITSLTKYRFEFALACTVTPTRPYRLFAGKSYFLN